MANIRKLTFKDLKSLYNLKDWVRTNTNSYVNDNIPKQNVLIIIDYLKDSIRDSDLPNKRTWIKSLNNLIERVEVIDE